MNVLEDVSARLSSFKIDCANCGPPVVKESQDPQFVHFHLLTNCLKNCFLSGTGAAFFLAPLFGPALGYLVLK